MDAPRLLLHAWSLSMEHPITGEALELIAPPDRILRQLFERFEWTLALPETLQSSLCHPPHPSMDAFIQGPDSENPDEM